MCFGLGFYEAWDFAQASKPGRSKRKKIVMFGFTGSFMMIRSCILWTLSTMHLPLGLPSQLSSLLPKQQQPFHEGSVMWYLVPRNILASRTKYCRKANIWSGEIEIFGPPPISNHWRWYRQVNETSSSSALDTGSRSPPLAACGRFWRLLHLQNAGNGWGQEVGRMHQVLEMVPHEQMSEHFP